MPKAFSGKARGHVRPWVDKPLSDELRWSVGPVSPGTNDYICPNPGHTCTDFDLAELRETVAVAAYMETEFHTWTIGVNWLWDDWSWRWRIGVAVDQYLGYP